MSERWEYVTMLITGDLAIELSKMGLQRWRLKEFLGADEKGTMVLLEREKELIEKPNGIAVDLITGRPKHRS